MELIIDPTKKPLSSRILANAGAVPTQPKASKANGKKQAAAAPAKKQGNKQGGKTKTKRPAKKTIEQLDQEMSDYFEKKD